MTKLWKLLVLSVLFLGVAAVTAASASASLPRPDRSTVIARGVAVRGLLVRPANAGLPPVIGGPYGDPADFPGIFGSSVRSDSAAGSSDSSSGDDCLHQVVQPRTAC